MWVCDKCFRVVLRPSVDECPRHEYVYLGGGVWRCQNCRRMAGGSDWGI